MVGGLVPVATHAARADAACCACRFPKGTGLINGSEWCTGGMAHCRHDRIPARACACCALALLEPWWALLRAAPQMALDAIFIARATKCTFPASNPPNNCTLFAADYDLYLAIFYTLTAILVVAAGLCIFVAINFKNNHFPYLWYAPGGAVGSERWALCSCVQEFGCGKACDHASGLGRLVLCHWVPPCRPTPSAGPSKY